MKLQLKELASNEMLKANLSTLAAISLTIPLSTVSVENFSKLQLVNVTV